MRGFESWRSEKSDGSSNFEQLWFENAKKFLDYQRLHQSDYQDKGLGVVFADNDAIADRIFSFKNKVEADADCDVDRVADADRDAYADVNCSKRSKRNWLVSMFAINASDSTCNFDM